VDSTKPEPAYASPMGSQTTMHASRELHSHRVAAG
jgi:hypothetical protein